jgi:dolichol-phosphate mannosyltransferase
MRKGKGSSRWTFRKKLTYMVDGVLGHSYVPIRTMTALGIFLSLSSLLAGLVFCVLHFFDPHIVPGWTSLAFLILFVGGIQLLMTGVLGEYIWRILAQVRGTPPFIVDTVLDGRSSECDCDSSVR